MSFAVNGFGFSDVGDVGDVGDPGDKRALRAHPLPTSTPKNKDLADSTPGLTFPSPDAPIHQFARSQGGTPYTHPRLA